MFRTGGKPLQHFVNCFPVFDLNIYKKRPPIRRPLVLVDDELIAFSFLLYAVDFDSVEPHWAVIVGIGVVVARNRTPDFDVSKELVFGCSEVDIRQSPFLGGIDNAGGYTAVCFEMDRSRGAIEVIFEFCDGVGRT